MARFTRIEVTQQMNATGMVPVFYHSDVEICKKILTACYDGGVRVFEFTNRGDRAHEVFNTLNQFAEREMPDLNLGIGSVIDAGTTSLYLQLGANFIVSPILNADMAKVCNRRKVAWSPGCGSLTEINKAEEFGCEIIKLFPGSTYGPGFVKAVKGPQPWTSIMPTGGVSTEESNLKAWFDAGVTCVGMGSKLISKEILEKKDFKGLENLVRNTLGTIIKIRN